ncbi:hypothetical protein ACOMHN_031803 [Nucella lapillus]
MADGIAMQKTKILPFITAHCDPYSKIPDLVELAEDIKALAKLHMQRQCGTYTMTHGLAVAVKVGLREKIQGVFLSLNIDEATNNAMDKIVNIIRYFDEEDRKLRTFHLASRSKSHYSTRGRERNHLVKDHELCVGKCSYVAFTKVIGKKKIKCAR